MAKLDLYARLRDFRYALPEWVGQIVKGPTAQAAAAICQKQHARGLFTTMGHFPGKADTIETVMAANLAVINALHDQDGKAYLSVKAPQLGFDVQRINTLAKAGFGKNISLMLDAHAPDQADATLDIHRQLSLSYPDTGCVLPARWQRSTDDAAKLREGFGRIRLVKGEWADQGEDTNSYQPDDCEARYLQIAEYLAGRSGTVAIATHDPQLAKRALSILLAANTPCELEQLRGLPMRQTTALARKMGVPVRLYVPFGEGWVPYAMNAALARPYFPGWYIRDKLGAINLE